MKIAICVVLLCTIEFSCILGLPVSENDVAVINTQDKGNPSTYYIPTPNIGIHKYHAEKKSWNDARNTCLNEGGHLVVINSAAEEALLIEYINITGVSWADELWIGVHELFKKDDWVSVKDQRLDAIGYIHWTPGQPDNTNNNEHCLAIKPTGLNDYICSEGLPFVCEM